MRLKLFIAGAGALLLLGAGLGASAYAKGGALSLLAAAKPSPSPGAQRAQACNDFLSHLATNLGVSQSKLQSALQKSVGQTIDDAVAAGKMSSSQAATIKQRLGNRTLCSFAPRFGGRAEPGMAGLTGAILKAAAETLNLTPAQLMQDIRQGKTLSSLAHGMSEAQFRAAFLGHLKTDLNAAVKAGKMTQAQENTVLQRAQTAPIPFWNTAPTWNRSGVGGFEPAEPVPGATPEIGRTGG